MAGALVAPATASADGGGTISVTVHAPPGTPSQTGRFVTVDGLKSDPQNCPTFPQTSLDLHGPGATPGEQSTKDGWSLATVLACLSPSIPLSQVHSMIVDRENGTPELALSRADLDTPSDFPDSSAVPIIYSDGTNLNYYRPWRGGTDNNLRDSSSYSDGISIEVFEGSAIPVQVSPPQQTIQENGSVTFTATVLDSSDSGLTYRWKFDGGATDTSGSPTTTAQFSNQGEYHVTVEVTDAAGGGGDASSDITVSGNAPPQGTDTNPNKGPTQSGGKTPNGNPGPGQGGTPGADSNGKSPSGTKPPNSSKHTTHTTSPNHKSSHHTMKTPTTPATNPSTSAQTNQNPNPTSGGGTTQAQPPTSTTPPHSSSPTGARTPHHHLKAPVTTPGEVVTGRLVSDVIPLPATSSPLVHTVAASAPTAPPRRVTKTSPIPVLAGALAIIALLALGAARELRGRRDWLTLRFGS